MTQELTCTNKDRHPDGVDWNGTVGTALSRPGGYDCPWCGSRVLSHGDQGPGKLETVVGDPDREVEIARGESLGGMTDAPGSKPLADRAKKIAESEVDAGRMKDAPGSTARSPRERNPKRR